MDSLPAREPGIYEGVPFEEYLTWPAVSNSSLGPAERSMQHYHLRQRVEETEAMRFGSFCHTGRLEPSAVYRRYVVMPDLTQGITTKDGKPAASPKATAEYKERLEKWRNQNGADKIVVTQADFDNMVGMVGSIDQHPLAREWFSSDGPCELSLLWDDPDTGIRCKARFDKLARRAGMIADLKTCMDCQRFGGDIVNRRYHRQGAMYIDGAMVLMGGEVFRFGLVAVEKERPFGVMAAPVSADAIDSGRELYKSALRQIAAARASGAWPGYESPTEWVLPAWARREATEPIVLTIGGELVTL